jgi:hypothetical protein
MVSAGRAWPPRVTRTVTSLNGTRSAYARSAVFERALAGHWAQGKTQGSGVFAKILHSSMDFSTQAVLFYSQNLLSNPSRAVHELLF